MPRVWQGNARAALSPKHTARHFPRLQVGALPTACPGEGLGGHGLSGCPKLQCPLIRGLVIVILRCRAVSPLRELRDECFLF